MKRVKTFCKVFFIATYTLLILHLTAQIALVATGCNYPTSLDSFTDKTSGDFLTVADVNKMACAIEKLQIGPVRLALGTIGAPSYSFQNDIDTGVWSSAANTVDVSGGGARIARFVPTTSAVNYLELSGHSAGNAPFVRVAGSDTDITLGLVPKNAGGIAFYRGSGVVDGLMSQGIFTWVISGSATTGAAVGDIMLGNAHHIRAANAGGTAAISLIELNSGDVVVLSANANDIQWGKPLVTLGGGATPTLGTIGGSGPTAAAQHSWMRVMDSGGAAFWVPAWK